MHRCHGWQKWITLFSFLFLFAGAAHADEFCVRSKAQLAEAFEKLENRIAFRNSGGIGNGGVCWWHSRLQRASLYLARYAPEKPRPTYEEAQNLIRSLVYFTRVIEIPGYSNFQSFSEDYQQLIQSELNFWQIRDGFIAQQWIRGLSGKSSLPASELQSHMETIYDRFQTSEPGLWLMVQIKGITSHALILIGMTRTEQGFQLRVIDSNRPMETRVVEFHTGDESLELGDMSFVPYLGFKRDQVLIDRVLQAYCGV
jgi:hypothetical protein